MADTCPVDHRETLPAGEPGAAGPGDVGVGVGLAVEDWTGDARFYEYSAAVDPIGSGATTTIPVRQFPARCHDPGTTRVVDLDLSDALVTPYPATGPSLLARFLCITAGDELDLAPNATSMLFYCLRGWGSTEIEAAGGPRRIPWRAGDVVTAPGGTTPRHRAEQDAVLYHVDDSPLLAYLGVEVAGPRFAPDPLRRRGRPGQARRGGGGPRRHEAQPSGRAPGQRPQRPDPDRDPHPVGHARRAAARATSNDPIAIRASPWTSSSHCDPGCYTLVGPEIGPDGTIVDPIRVDWEPGGAFVTPPGLWHSHHNESGAAANLLPGPGRRPAHLPADPSTSDSPGPTRPGLVTTELDGPTLEASRRAVIGPSTPLA